MEFFQEWTLKGEHDGAGACIKHSLRKYQTINDITLIMLMMWLSGAKHIYGASKYRQHVITSESSHTNQSVLGGIRYKLI